MNDMPLYTPLADLRLVAFLAPPRCNDKTRIKAPLSCILVRPWLCCKVAVKALLLVLLLLACPNNASPSKAV